MDEYTLGYDWYYVLGQPLPADASEDFKEGWADGRASAQAWAWEHDSSLWDEE